MPKVLDCTWCALAILHESVLTLSGAVHTHRWISSPQNAVYSARTTNTLRVKDILLGQPVFANFPATAGVQVLPT